MCISGLSWSDAIGTFEIRKRIIGSRYLLGVIDFRLQKFNDSCLIHLQIYAVFAANLTEAKMPNEIQVMRHMQGELVCVFARIQKWSACIVVCVPIQSDIQHLTANSCRVFAIPLLYSMSLPEVILYFTTLEKRSFFETFECVDKKQKPLKLFVI